MNERTWAIPVFFDAEECCALDTALKSGRHASILEGIRKHHPRLYTEPNTDGFAGDDGIRFHDARKFPFLMGYLVELARAERLHLISIFSFETLECGHSAAMHLFSVQNALVKLEKVVAIL